jgi:hypothetical protein
MKRSRQRLEFVEVEDLVDTMSEVERRLARRDVANDTAELDLLELEALMDLTLEREVA